MSDGQLLHLDLFSGVGGFALAAAWSGYTTIGFCEIDTFCQRVLRKHWADTPIHGDIRTLTGEIVEGWVMAARRKDYDEAVALYESGKSVGEIAERFGVTRQSMWKSLKRRGVEMRDNIRIGEDNHFHRGGPTQDGRAHDLVEKAIAAGTLVRQPCETCGESGAFKDGRAKVQAHHDDYNKPLEVRWLCQPCHHDWHKTHRAIRKEVMPYETTGADGLRVDLLTGGF